MSDKNDDEYQISCDLVVDDIGHSFLEEDFTASLRTMWVDKALKEDVL